MASDFIGQILVKLGSDEGAFLRWSIIARQALSPIHAAVESKGPKRA